MSAAKKKAKSRGPYAHVDDLRPALIALEAILDDLGENAHRWDLSACTRREFGGLPGASFSGILRDANEMVLAGHRLRHACRRVLVAQYGARDARRWDGWKMPVRKEKEA
jgi:hypothetical protein